jgi:Tol biopolymer transport system component
MYQFDNQPIPTNEGSHVYFRRIYDPQTSELWKMKYDGENKTRVHLPKDGYLEEFIVSPKDDQIAVIVSERKSDLMNGSSDLWILPIDKNKNDSKEDSEAPSEVQDRKLTTVGYSIKYINFSSNNKTIAFSMKEQPTTSDILTDIWKVNSNNTELTRLTPKDDYMDIKPIWSPDGSKIAFFSGKGEHFNLWLMDGNGEGRTALDRKIQVVGTPLWSKDSQSIYVSDIRGNIFEFNLKDNQIYRLVKGY